jgi:hypothetical protein
VADLSSPLCQRGPEALARLLAGDLAASEAQLRLLTRTELGLLSTTAQRLSVLANRIVRDVWPHAGQ